MKTTSKVFWIVFLGSTFITCGLFAFPDQERLLSNLAQPPLTILSTQPSDKIVDSDNRFAYFSSGNQIIRVDLASWALAVDQIPALDDENEDDTLADLAGNVEGLAIRNNSLFGTQDDGDLIIVDLDDVTAEPRAVKVNENNLGKVVADTSNGGGDTLYIADQTARQIVIFDISDEAVTANIPLLKDAAELDPVELIFIDITGGTNKVYVSTPDSTIYQILVGETTATQIDLTDSGALSALAAHPEGLVLFVLDETNSVIIPLTVADNSEPSGGTLRIDLSSVNGDLSDMLVTPVNNPSGHYAYVAGSEGISVIELNFNLTTLTSVVILDMVEGEDESPLPLANGNVAQQLFTASDEYVLTVNGNASISIISENPFVSVTADSLDGQPLGVGGMFTLTFESDEAGTYEVRVGGDIDASGTLVDSGDVPAADTAVITAEIMQSDDFQEGLNEVFVFVTDADGQRGRDMHLITVDTPPPAVVLRSTNFGNQKAFITFDRLDVSDVAHYNIYADPSAQVVLTKQNSSGSVDQPESGDSVTGEATGLMNGVTYFLAVEAVDDNGNVGPRVNTLADGTLAQAIPQATIGLTGSVGEFGCQLMPGPQAGEGPHALGWWILFLSLLLLLFFRQRRLLFFAGLMLILFGLVPAAAMAVESTPQWFSLEIKVGNWFYTDDVTDRFMSKCCNIRTEIDFGVLIDSKYGFEIGVGFLTANRTAVGSIGGQPSGDRFNLTLVPMKLNATYRFDYIEKQPVVPYVKVGPDMVYFRENVQGNVTEGLKYGIHGTLGLQILLDFWGEGDAMSMEWGVNDVYFIIEGEYAYINDFGRGGLNLSGIIVSGGFLFEF